MAPDLEHRYQSADAMIADLGGLPEEPEVEMKFDLSDLRPEENDEPTRTIRTMPSHTVTIPVHQPERNYPRRERDEDEEPRHTGSGKRGVLVSAVTVGGGSRGDRAVQDHPRLLCSCGGGPVSGAGSV